MPSTTVSKAPIVPRELQTFCKEAAKPLEDEKRGVNERANAKPGWYYAEDFHSPGIIVHIYADPVIDVMCPRPKLADDDLVPFITHCTRVHAAGTGPACAREKKRPMLYLGAVNATCGLWTPLYHVKDPSARETQRHREISITWIKGARTSRSTTQSSINSSQIWLLPTRVMLAAGRSFDKQTAVDARNIATSDEVEKMMGRLSGLRRDFDLTTETARLKFAHNAKILPQQPSRPGAAATATDATVSTAPESAAVPQIPPAQPVHRVFHADAFIALAPSAAAVSDAAGRLPSIFLVVAKRLTSVVEQSATMTEAETASQVLVAEESRDWQALMSAEQVAAQGAAAREKERRAALDAIAAAVGRTDKKKVRGTRLSASAWMSCCKDVEAAVRVAHTAGANQEEPLLVAVRGMLRLMHARGILDNASAAQLHHDDDEPHLRPEEVPPAPAGVALESYTRQG